MNIVRFAPDTLIEIDDTMRSFRKLAFVDELGEAYVDLIEADATTFPIYAALHPVAVGNSLSWGLEIIDQQPAEACAFNLLQRSLLAAGLDSLTYSRALYWAYQARAFDYAEALAAGRKATDQVKHSRQFLDQLAKRGRAAHLRLV